MDFRRVLLAQHGRCHALEVGGVDLSVQVVVLNGITDEQMLQRPAPSTNSLAYVLWHMTRTEDIGLNTIITERPQVFDAGGWATQLNVMRRDFGSGMTDAEVDAFNQQINVRALFAYRVAVGQRTQAILCALKPETLEEVIDDHLIQRAQDEGAFGPHAAWVPQRWMNKRKEYTLTWSVLAHTFLHFGEAYNIRKQLGLSTL
jgi:hypothetical protein